MKNTETILTRFKVKNFRSIEDSDWIEVADNSCLVGTNESGKTNLLIALWKLNPANNEPIIPLDDFPRLLFSKYEAENYEEEVFISADFLLGEQLQVELAEELECDIDQIKVVLVEREYSGEYHVSFPYTKIDQFDSKRLKSLLEGFSNNLQSQEIFNKEGHDLKSSIIDFLKIKIDQVPENFFDLDHILSLRNSVIEFVTSTFGQKKKLPEYFNTFVIAHLDKFISSFKGDSIDPSETIIDRILESIPQFVYYSDYGNLDSEIFLPRVIEDFKREDLGGTARAKARTLEVLFKYVNLSPQEIFELGNDAKVIIKTVNHNNVEISKTEEKLTDQEIKQWSDKKRKRNILLESAATQLTESFKHWWLQGDYIFQFKADGNHFRINVSDSLRPEPIELEGRSRGLQWFFSFFLVFLVETKENHSNTILLLDEPGLSLHPLAQYDLAKFFRKLSEDNQLIYTSHSPFLVDIDNLANVKAVYVNKDSGRTNITSNLRYDEKDSEKSIYPVHAALGLTVSDTLLLGCKPILVEGPSDQIYLSFIKRFLIGKGTLKYSKEFVFIPVGGVKGMSPVSKLVSSRDNELPIVLLDSDKAGKDYKKNLLNGKYKESKDKVLEVNDFLKSKDYEIEDLIPHEILIKIIDRMFRGNEYFDDVYVKNEPIVDQIQQWAKNNKIDLKLGWKVDLSREVINRSEKYFEDIKDETAQIWESLFKALSGE
ncbi:AAA family ATPase [Aquimarina algiphila]|uniref:AAA family ATPase n=1 Tax=Aquimarina algiphila TaxID=2047982 RepID=UPI00232F7211|nr:AAA family ATPase [Aquimarina algiphila]